jgi:phosphoglycolate phosphatase-like HAD superfamily hydrolase
MIEVFERPAHRPTVVAVDFDGTMSLIRIGWQTVMHAVMHRALAPWHPKPHLLDDEIHGYIARSTGQPSIIQMAWVDEHVMLYGGIRHGAQYYLDQFSTAMSAQIDARIASIHDDASADDCMVPGARGFLQMLKAHDVPIALVSGTERHHLIRESQALRIHDYFNAGIYGPGVHAPTFTKHDAMQHLVDQYQAPAGTLVSVGDGPVEIQAGKALLGYGIGVASHEQSGGLDPAKRNLLVQTGADAIIANFTAVAELQQLLFATPSAS